MTAPIPFDNLVFLINEYHAKEVPSFTDPTKGMPVTQSTPAFAAAHLVREKEAGVYDQISGFESSYAAYRARYNEAAGIPQLPQDEWLNKRGFRPGDDC